MPGMAFCVINTVRGEKDELLPLVAEVRRLSFDSMPAHPGFRSARLYTAEDGSEAIMAVEWESRDHFQAYRQSDDGQRIVSWALQYHPRIGFYEVTATADAPSR